MGGVFSKPKPPPPPPPEIDEAAQRRADMLEAEEGRERKIYLQEERLEEVGCLAEC